MRSLADMPKPIIVLEGVGILLIIVLLATKNICRRIVYGLWSALAVWSRNGQYWSASNSWPEFLGIDNKQPERMYLKARLYR